MTETPWLDILSRTSPKRPVQLDALIAGDDKSKPNGKVVFPEGGAAPSVVLWDREEDGPTYIGIRVLKAPDAPHKTARLLAAAALEREVFPVILSRVDHCGFEQFGFRVERIPEEPSAAQAAEDEVRKFWDLAIIIDGTDVGLWSG